ncbi:MAG: ATP-grasp domain-containing protein [Ignavibacteriaceae bacterium]|nr:ATP-grasp domain-containing protein [Ignavibacteriaceae bacterium]
MSEQKQRTVLCFASYEKGAEFMRECKRQGCRVILLTSKSLEYAEWPRESLDQVFYIPDVNKEWNMNDVIYGVSYMARTEDLDIIVALDDFDVEKAAAVREHLRIPGMGDTTARYFRDKLAMRTRAKEVGINVPEFIHVLNHNKINEFADRVPFPYVIKPRLQAGAIGIKKVHSKWEMWEVLNRLGDQQSFYLIEQFVPGDVFHVDSIIYGKKVVFQVASKYGKPPMEVSHQGRVFTSVTMDRNSEESKKIFEMNAEVLPAFGIVRGVSHSEYIRSENGEYYFLETSARVGGAHIAELVEAASGVNLWAEWAKIELHPYDGIYEAPKDKGHFAGIMISLAKQEYPDTSSYNDPEVWWRMKKPNHVGLIVASPDEARVNELVEKYTGRYYEDFFATQPVPDKPSA